MKFYSLSQLNGQEKNNILDKHKEIYNGYKTVWRSNSNEQPLYTQDFANDKMGVQVDSLGNVTNYNNKVYMNENIDEINLKKVDVEEELNLDKVQDIDPEAEFDFIEPKEVDFSDFSSAYTEELEEEIGGPLYSEVDPAYNFVSKGPGRRMEENSYEEVEEGFYDTNDYDYMDMGPESFEDTDDDMEDVTSYDEDLITKIRKKPSEQIDDIEFEDLDEDLKEEFYIQKNKINEMFLRFSKYN